MTSLLVVVHYEGKLYQSSAFRAYLLVEQAVDNEEEGALLGVKNDEEDLEEEVGLVQAQNPGTAQYDKLGHNLEQNQPTNNEN